MRTKRKTTRTTTTKIRTIATSAALTLLTFMVAVSVSPAQSNSAKKSKEAPHAVIAGTVFRDPGFAQPGATVSLARKDDPKMKKLQESVSDNRGEFAFRVPPVPSKYVVHATLKGFKAVSEEVEINGEEQVNATLVLVPESK